MWKKGMGELELVAGRSGWIVSSTFSTLQGSEILGVMTMAGSEADSGKLDMALPGEEAPVTPRIPRVSLPPWVALGDILVALVLSRVCASVLAD